METNTELKMIHLSEVESQQIKWLWYPFIPYGKLSIVQGDPGDGKSTLILNIAAKLSRGECIDENMNITEPVNVIYQTAEDGLADTVKPRLEAANADCSRISIIDESDKSVSMTDDRIEEAIKRENAKLCIFDPIQAYLGGDTDMNRANEAREMTKKLGSIAERTGCAIVLIGHMNKGSGAKAAYRGMGSIDFFAVARSVMLVGRIEGLDCQHFFRQIFLGYFSDIVQAFDTLRKNVCGDDYTSLHNPIVLSSVLPAYGMFHSIQILFL